MTVDSSALPIVSAIILTYNEEQNLPACLSSLQLLACPIFVVDSGSTDRTLEIAAQFGAVILEHPFTTHTQQWAWALKNIPVESDWVLALDADQTITSELAAEIRTQLGSSIFDGLYIKRRQVFRGRWIKHGGYYPKYLLKLFRRDKLYLHAGDAVDHHFYVRGPWGKLQYDLIEANHKEDNISFWIEKHNRYAALMAAEEQHKWDGRYEFPIAASLFGSPDQRVLWLKRLWSRLPLFVRPTLYFTYRYFLRTGFLDGKEGFIFHFLQAYWYRLLVDINLDDIRNMSRDSETPHGENAESRQALGGVASACGKGMSRRGATGPYGDFPRSQGSSNGQTVVSEVQESVVERSPDKTPLETALDFLPPEKKSQNEKSQQSCTL